MKKVLIIVGLILLIIGLYFGFSESYSGYYNVKTGQFQSGSNPSTVIKTFYPNSWLGTVICVFGAVALSASTLLARKGS